MAKRRAAKPPPTELDDLDDVAEVGGLGADDDFAGVAVVTGSGGAVAFVPIPPAGVARLGPDAVALVSALQRSVIERRELLRKMDGLVEELRELGVSWNVIGWSVGTSAEAARQRWS
jgi:hypothetical protein